MIKLEGHPILNATNVKGADVAALPILEVQSTESVYDDVKKQSEDSKEKVGQNNAIQNASAPLQNTSESNNVLSDYISNDLINKNMFNITEIKNALLNALKIEFGKLLTMELSKEQAHTLRSNVEKLKYRELFKLNEKFTLPDNPTLKDEFVVHMLSTEMERLSEIKLWKSHLMIDLAGKLLKNIDCITPIEKRVLNVKSK